ncbi:MAG: hypothetical protein OQL20_07735, partial [Sedimenticola sp.]|nr:hypothetical protein [Sedimenticola sp.]
MSKISHKPWNWLALVVLFIVSISPLPAAERGTTTLLGEEIPHGFDPETGKRIISNERCLTCHGDEKQQTDVRDDGSPVKIFVHREEIEA